jgi:hypothetical protein
MRKNIDIGIQFRKRRADVFGFTFGLYTSEGEAHGCLGRVILSHPDEVLCHVERSV